ncbi:MAG: hypothetical protein ABL879_01580 [Devosia sp.]
MEKLTCSAFLEPNERNPERRRVSVLGREAWALLELVEAGVTGCTPIDNPAPRWSHYVRLLRRDGFRVETIHEDHAGPFSGSHARYLLHDQVTLDGGNLSQWRPNGVRYPQPVRVAA